MPLLVGAGGVTGCQPQGSVRGIHGQARRLREMLLLRDQMVTLQERQQGLGGLGLGGLGSMGLGLVGLGFGGLGLGGLGFGGLGLGGVQAVGPLLQQQQLHFPSEKAQLLTVCPFLLVPNT